MRYFSGVIGIIVIIFLTACSSDINETEMFSNHVVNMEFSQAYDLIRSSSNRQYLKENQVLENIFNNLNGIESYQVNGNEITFFGKTSSEILEINIKQDELFSVSYEVDNCEEEIPLKLPEDVLTSLEDTYIDLDDYELIQLNEDKYLLKNFQCKVLLEKKNNIWYVPLLDSNSRMQSMNSDLDISHYVSKNRASVAESYIETENEIYESIKTNADIFQDYLEEDNYVYLYSLLSDELASIFNVETFKDYIRLMKKKVAANHISDMQMVAGMINVSYEKAFALCIDFSAFDNQTYYVDGVIETSLDNKILEANSYKSIENVYYYGYYNDFKVISDIDVDRFLEDLRLECKTIFSDKLSEDEAKRLFDYQKQIAGDFSGLIIKKDVYPVDSLTAWIHEYINISSEGKVSRLIITTDYFNNVIDYNIAFMNGVNDEITD